MCGVNRKVLLHAVVRSDEHFTHASEAVTIVAIVPTKDEAVREVARLNELAGTRSSCFWTPAKYYPDGRGVDSGST
jgi:hypothetical protein